MPLSTLTSEEIAAVLRKEYHLRSHYEYQGQLEESGSIIRQLKAKILLAAADRETALRFFSLLEADCANVDFLQIYQAGKESRAAGETEREGVYRCLRCLSLDPDRAAFAGELQRAMASLIAMMPGGEASAYPEYLLAEYRATYGAVNRHIEEFFRLGYEAQEHGRREQAFAP